MGKYTAQIRLICEHEAGLTESTGFSGVNQVIQAAIPKVFDFDFPIYDESYRNVLCTKILKHYYLREIGAETVGQWKLWLDTRLNEIMPYYNQLYKSAMIEFNPMYDVDISTKHTRKNDGTTNVEENGTENGSRTVQNSNDEIGKSDAVGSSKEISSSNGKNDRTQNNTQTKWDAFSDTPQGTLENVESMTYLTNARKITDEGTINDNQTSENSETVDTESKSNIGTERHVEFSGNESNNRTTDKNENTVVSSTEEYVQTVRGKNGGTSYSKMLTEFRKTFINIDKMIIDELSDLFFGLW